jgi:hypothetical protein
MRSGNMNKPYFPSRRRSKRSKRKRMIELEIKRLTNDFMGYLEVLMENFKMKKYKESPNPKNPISDGYSPELYYQPNEVLNPAGKVLVGDTWGPPLKEHQRFTVKEVHPGDGPSKICLEGEDGMRAEDTDRGLIIGPWVLTSRHTQGAGPLEPSPAMGPPGQSQEFHEEHFAGDNPELTFPPPLATAIPAPKEKTIPERLDDIEETLADLKSMLMGDDCDLISPSEEAKEEISTHIFPEEVELDPMKHYMAGRKHVLEMLALYDDSGENWHQVIEDCEEKTGSGPKVEEKKWYYQDDEVLDPHGCIMQGDEWGPQLKLFNRFIASSSVDTGGMVIVERRISLHSEDGDGEIVSISLFPSLLIDGSWVLTGRRIACPRCNGNLSIDEDCKECKGEGNIMQRAKP